MSPGRPQRPIYCCSFRWSCIDVKHTWTTILLFHFSNYIFFVFFIKVIKWITPFHFFTFRLLTFFINTSREWKHEDPDSCMWTEQMGYRFFLHFVRNNLSDMNKWTKSFSFLSFYHMYHLFRKYISFQKRWCVDLEFGSIRRVICFWRFTRLRITPRGAAFFRVCGQPHERLCPLPVSVELFMMKWFHVNVNSCFIVHGCTYAPNRCEQL